MIQSSCISDDHLRGLLLGELSDDDATPLENHLLECPACVARTRKLQSADTFVAALQHARKWELPAAQSSSIEMLVQRLSDRSQLATHSSLLDATVAPGEKESPSVQELIALLEPAVEPDELGRLSSFRVLKLLGHGGMGAVFLAEDMQLRRHVAFKLLKPGRSESSEAIERFMREARAAAAVRHDHVVTIYQVGQAHGVPFIAQELLEGETLDDALKRLEGVRPPANMPIADVLRIGREIAAGLAAAHARGLLHRDVKPSNIWLENQESGARSQEVSILSRLQARLENQESGARSQEPEIKGPMPEADDRNSFPSPESLVPRPSAPRVKILDFGLARSQQGDEQLTQAGIVVGTPAYMSPEQAANQPLDARSDLFSLGGVLYRMVTGRLPFQGTDTLSMLRSLAVDDPPAASSLNPEIPAELSTLIARLLSKEISHRPNSADAVVRALASIENQLNNPTTASQPASGLNITASRRLSPSRRSKSHLLIALSAAAAAIVLCGIVITITHRDGTKTKIELEGDSKLEIAASAAAGLPGRAPTQKDTGSKAVPEPRTGLAPQSDSAVASPIAPLPPGGSDLAAAQWALRIGGNLTIQIDGETADIQSLDKLPDRAFHLTKLNLAKRPIHDHDLSRLTGLNQLDSLELRETAISDAGLAHLEKLPALKQLLLYKTKITDAAFDSFTKMPALRELSLTETKTTAAGWRRLQELPRLSQLHVAMMPFTDSDLAELVAGQPELETLNLWGTAVTDAGMPHLAKLSKLQLLHLNFTKVTGRGLAPLGNLPLLESLGLPSQISFADEAANNLSSAPALASLDFHNTNLTDAGLMFLGKIQSLRNLNLSGTKITSAGLADLVNLPHLTSLQLLYPPISEQHATFLSQMAGLTKLELGEVQTDKALASLSRLNQLEELHLAGGNLSEVGLLALTETKSLKTLVLKGSRLSPAAVERLRLALPQADIQLHGVP